MINSVSLTGRLTRDPDVRRTNNGKSVATLSIAVERNFKNQNGEREADFINCVAFGNTAEVIEKYCNKGIMVGVEGRLQTRNYENKQGQRVYVTEVIVNNFSFLESAKSRNANGNNYNANNQGFNDQPDPFTGQIDDNDLPF